MAAPSDGEAGARRAMGADAAIGPTAIEMAARSAQTFEPDAPRPAPPRARFADLLARVARVLLLRR